MDSGSIGKKIPLLSVSVPNTWLLEGGTLGKILLQRRAAGLRMLNIFSPNLVLRTAEPFLLKLKKKFSRRQTPTTEISAETDLAVL